MKNYWKKLKNHPGISIAIAFTFIFPLAGLGNENNWKVGVIAGLVFSSVVWTIVLWTARHMPIQEDGSDD